MKAKTKAKIFAVFLGLFFFSTIGMLAYNKNVDEEEDKIPDYFIVPFMIVSVIMVVILIILLFIGGAFGIAIAGEIKKEAGQGNYASSRPRSSG